MWCIMDVIIAVFILGAIFGGLVVAAFRSDGPVIIADETEHGVERS